MLRKRLLTYIHSLSTIEVESVSVYCTGIQIADVDDHGMHACMSLIVVKCVVVIMRHDCAFCRR